jgi:ribosomal protein RSM22 (predicted rRNA methylase)
MSDTNATVKTPATSDLIVEFLAAKGRKSRKAGIATTQEIADHIGKSLKYTYDRLWWLAKKESRLLMIGSGKTATWRSVPKARKAKAADGIVLSEDLGDQLASRIP